EGPAMRTGEDAAWAGRARLRHHAPLRPRRAGPRVPDHLQRRRSAGGLPDPQAPRRRHEPPRAWSRSAGAHALSRRQARPRRMGRAARRGAEDVTGAAHDPDAGLAPAFAAPPQACDAHFHVFGPAGRYAYGSDLRYQPPHAPLEDYLKLARRLGFVRFVFVQPSAYGLDNSFMFDAMDQLD